MHAGLFGTPVQAALTPAGLPLAGLPPAGPPLAGLPLAGVPDRCKLCVFKPFLSPEGATLVAWKATELPVAAELPWLAGDTAPAC